MGTVGWVWGSQDTVGMGLGDLGHSGMGLGLGSLGTVRMGLGLGDLWAGLGGDGASLGRVGMGLGDHWGQQGRVGDLRTQRDGFGIFGQSRDGFGAGIFGHDGDVGGGWDLQAWWGWVGVGGSLGTAREGLRDPWGQQGCFWGTWGTEGWVWG